MTMVAPEAGLRHSPVPGDTCPEQLPGGFRVRLCADVSAHPLPDGERLLVGGSPLRAVRLKGRAVALLSDGSLTVADAPTAALARRLLDANLADPDAGAAPAPAALTVVVPVRDRPEQLDRCLAALAGLEVVVVDDASLDPASVGAVARRHGATLLTLPANLGPAGARNAGLARVTTPCVAFVDSDVTVTAETLLGLAAHLADPRLGLCGPLVRGVARAARPRWFERYDAAASSLALGTRACAVRPGAAVGWLPSACLVGRTAALRSVHGFDAERRVGEDVDLVLRLVEAGWRVRYQPDRVALHDVRGTLGGWLGRKLVYGSGGAALAARHGDAVAVARMSPLMALAGAGVLLRRPVPLVAALAATGWVSRGVRDSLPKDADRDRIAATLAVKGLGWSVRQQAALLLRHWWPLTLLACLVSRTARRMVGTALAVDLVVARTVDRPLPQPRLGRLEAWAGRRLDDLAYGCGLWLGAVRARDARCLAPQLTRGRPRRPRAGTGTADG